MNFLDFLNCIPKIETEILPAGAAHLKMMPPERADLMQQLDLTTINPRKAAVLMLFYPKQEETHLVLIVRNSYPGVHSSQIAFPGGKVEHFDQTIAHTALRETHEEIGVAPVQIQLVRAFTEIYIPPSNFMVYPFLAYSRENLSFKPDPKEVADIIELPLVEFMNEAIVVSQNRTTSYSDSIAVPAFKIDSHYVWGATAMMLSELKETLKKVL